MFSDIYRNSAENTGKYVEDLSLTFPKLKTELFVFYCCFCLARSSKNDSLFLGNIALSQLILKIVS